VVSGVQVDNCTGTDKAQFEWVNGLQGLTGGGGVDESRA